jgi:hypothetical protein
MRHFEGLTMKIKLGQRVAFSQAVLRRAGCDKTIADMRGTVIELISAGKVARVDTHGTWPNEDGGSIRAIPCANLTPIMSSGAVFGD